jgi:hypothetical protein
MKYTAKQIDSMSIESIEALANNLTLAELEKWAGSGYDGKCYVAIIKSRK